MNDTRTPLTLLVAAVIIGSCNAVTTKIEQLYEDQENLIEPARDPWIVLTKPKAKSTTFLKDIVLALKKLDSRKKNTSYVKSFEIEATGKTNMPSQKNNDKQIPTSSISLDNQDKANDKASVNNPATLSFARVLPPLHLQTEDNKRFMHSIVDGWNF